MIVLFFRASSFSAVADPDLSRLNSTLDSETLNNELERWKQEMLAEMRKEFNEMKIDLLKGEIPFLPVTDYRLFSLFQ